MYGVDARLNQRAHRIRESARPRIPLLFPLCPTATYRFRSPQRPSLRVAVQAVSGHNLQHPHMVT